MGPFKPDSLARQACEVGARIAIVPVKAKVIGSDGIQNDQDHVRSLVGRRGTPRSRPDSAERIPKNRPAHEQGQDRHQDWRSVAHQAAELRQASLDPGGGPQGDPGGQEAARQGIQAAAPGEAG